MAQYTLNTGARHEVWLEWKRIKMGLATKQDVMEQLLLRDYNRDVHQLFNEHILPSVVQTEEDKSGDTKFDEVNALDPNPFTS